jgi:hypothetical protein
MPCFVEPTKQELELIEQQRAQQLVQPLEEEILDLQTKLAQRDAMLCGILSSVFALDGYIKSSMVSEDHFSSAVKNWFAEAEAGVTWDDVIQWWTAHQEQDRQREQDEAAQREQLRQELVNKLSSEERALLGV